MESKYYQNYHKHTSLSNVYISDSPLVPKDYFEYYKSFNCPQIYSTLEHGFQGNYFKIYDDLEKFNKKNNTSIKFVFGVEAYWVKDRFEKDNSNCHICLLAINDKGRKAINKAISEANKTGYYYRPRLDTDLILSLPKDDVFVTSACIAFWNKYDDIDNFVLKLNKHFSNFYLEVQAHNTQAQKELNQHILELSNEYNIPIIFGTDSHVIKESQMKDRDDLLKSKKIFYEDEVGWYVDCPTYDDVVKRFQEQGILNNQQIETALQNTNVILDFEDIILDRSLKVPVVKKYQNLTQDERNEIFVNILRAEWKKQIDDINKGKWDEYIAEIKQDIEEIEACGMADYFILSYEVMKLGQEKYGGVLTPSGRGSAVSMYINKLLRLTKVDRINSPVLMYPERFLTKERVLESHTPPDVDNNVSEREPFIEAQRELIGENGTYDLIAFGTLHYKSAFKMYARAYNLDPQVANDVTKQIDKYELALKHAEDDEKDLVNIFDYVERDKYENLILGCQDYMGIIDNRKGHPCATICFDGDVEEDIGIILCKSETTGKEVLTALIESGTIDAFGYLKQDYLVVDSVGLMYKIYEEIGIEPLTVNELLREINNNQKVWDIYKNGYAICVNQCEQSKSTQKVMKYQPKNISELTQFIAGIRPSFQSMYKIFEAREHFEYGIKTFDQLLQDEYCDSSFILYQETLMKVLGFAGFPMSETYTIIKAISKKKDYIIKEAKPKFIKNFAQAIIDTGDAKNFNSANELAEKVWKIVEDSAAYGFNSAHAFCMAIDSVTLAYLKAYYPLEFYKVTLQRFTDKGEKDKVSLLKKEMLERGYNLKPLKFGDDNRKFLIDKSNNCITQTMTSIKNMPKATAQILYKIRNKQFTDRFELYDCLLNQCEITNKAIDILLRLDYFNDYVEINQGIFEIELFRKFSQSKVLSKDNLSGIEHSSALEVCNKETEKQFRDFEPIQFIKSILSHSTIPPTTTLDKIHYEITLLGYTTLTDEDVDVDDFAVINIEINQWGTPWATLYNIYYGNTNTYKIDKQWYKSNPIKKGDIIKCGFKEKDKRKKIVNEDGSEDWIATGESETVLKVYSLQKEYDDEN